MRWLCAWHMFRVSPHISHHFIGWNQPTINYTQLSLLLLPRFKFKFNKYLSRRMGINSPSPHLSQVCTFANSQFGENFGPTLEESPFFRAISVAEGTCARAPGADVGRRPGTERLQFWNMDQVLQNPPLRSKTITHKPGSRTTCSPPSTGYCLNMFIETYSPRFAWGGRPHRRFISVRERG